MYHPSFFIQLVDLKRLLLDPELDTENLEFQMVEGEEMFHINKDSSKSFTFIIMYFIIYTFLSYEISRSTHVGA